MKGRVALGPEQCGRLVSPGGGDGVLCARGGGVTREASSAPGYCPCPGWAGPWRGGLPVAGVRTPPVSGAELRHALGSPSRAPRCAVVPDSLCCLAAFVTGGPGPRLGWSRRASASAGRAGGQCGLLPVGPGCCAGGGSSQGPSVAPLPPTPGPVPLGGPPQCPLFRAAPWLLARMPPFSEGGTWGVLSLQADLSAGIGPEGAEQPHALMERLLCAEPGPGGVTDPSCLFVTRSWSGQASFVFFWFKMPGSHCGF